MSIRTTCYCCHRTFGEDCFRPDDTDNFCEACTQAECPELPPDSKCCLEEPVVLLPGESMTGAEFVDALARVVEPRSDEEIEAWLAGDPDPGAPKADK